MNRNAEAMIKQAHTYVSLFDRVSVGDRFEGSSSDGPIRLVTDQELIDALTNAARLRRLAQAEETKLAGEIARRSEPKDDTSLARRMGASSAANLVAQVAGSHARWRGRWWRPGRRSGRGRTRSLARPSKRGGRRSPPRSAAGLLDPEVAAAMRRALSKAAPGLAPFEVDELERQVVARSQEGWDAELFLAFLRKLPEYAHPNGGSPAPGESAPLQSVHRKVLSNGLVQWVLLLDPTTDGFLKIAIDTNTAIKRSNLTTPEQPADDADTADRRPLAQRRVDGVRLLAKQALNMDDGQVGGTAVTMLVTITEQALKSGLGTAQLPDCGTEISASIARMLAADAEIIPVVLGGKSQPLDLGLGRRYFTEAQRRAMAVRDGGCVGPGCDAPPSWCDGAHIRPAGYGATDLDNGVLLCWRCHLLHDLHGWQLQRTDERWWWTPPPWIDPTGRRRPGGRIPPPDLAA